VVLKFVKLTGSERDRFRDRFLLCSISSLSEQPSTSRCATMEFYISSPRGTPLFRVFTPWTWSSGGSAPRIQNAGSTTLTTSRAIVATTANPGSRAV